MDPALSIATLASIACSLLAGLALLRVRNASARAFAGLSLSVALWMGSVVASLTLPDPGWQVASQRLFLISVLMMPPFWLALAQRLVPGPLWGMGPLPAGWLFGPSALFALALLTNGAHGLFLPHGEEVVFGRVDWGGPLFLLDVVWGSTLLGLGGARLARGARELWASGDCATAAPLGVAALLPLLSVALIVAGWVPAGYPAVATAMALVVALLAITAMRYDLASEVPLAHASLINSLRTGVVVADTGGIVRECNPAAAELLGDMSIAGHPVARLVERLEPASSCSDTISRLARLAEHSEPVRFSIRTDSGRLIDGWARALRDDSGAAIGQVATFCDRTKERSYSEMIHRTRQLETFGTLATGVAHEINNPLSYVRANVAELVRKAEIADQLPPEAKIAEELADLREIGLETLEGIARIETLVADTRLLSSAPDEGFSNIDLNDVAQDAVRLARLRHRPGISIELDLHELPVYVEGSRALLVQATLNLLVNALQATAMVARPGIRVVTGMSGENGELSVIDDGPGVSDGFERRIFTAGFTTREGSTGLGLTVAAGVVRDHSGLLEYRRDDNGSHFRMAVPIAGDTP